jgi:hypothetical protein
MKCIFKRIMNFIGFHSYRIYSLNLVHLREIKRKVEISLFWN